MIQSSKLLCKRDFAYYSSEHCPIDVAFYKGNYYNYRINNVGKNIYHIVSLDGIKNNSYNFVEIFDKFHAYIWDYFYSVDETRNNLIDEIID